MRKTGAAGRCAVLTTSPHLVITMSIRHGSGARTPTAQLP